MLIIHVLPHSIDDFWGKDFEHHSTRFISRLKRFSPDDQFELWTLSKSIQTPSSFQHRNGFLIRIFPCLSFLPLPVEFSFSMLKAVFFKAWKEKHAVWHLHSYYFWMYDALAILLFCLRQKFLAQHRGGGASFTLKAFLYTIYHYGFALPLTLRMAKKILVQNHREEKRLMVEYGIPLEKIVFFPNIVDGAEQEITPTHPSIFNDRLTMLYVGRFEHIKGVLVLIQHFLEILKKCPGSILQFVGKGSLEQAMREEIQKLGLEQQIRISPWISVAEVVSFYRSSTIFLYPNERTEGMPASLIEAQYHGLPAIGFKISGVEDVIANNETGFLVRSLPEFQEKTIMLLRDPTLRKQMSVAARKRAREQFSAEQFYPLLIKIYHRL